MIECFRLGLYWQGVVHDLSKFGWIEFGKSARRFSLSNNKVDQYYINTHYEYDNIAWSHHVAKNKHHWEHWIDYTVDGRITAKHIPKKFVKEMFCNFIAASKVYNKKQFSKEEPLNWFLSRQDSMWFEESSKSYLRKLLEDYSKS